jgi:hypothetical protein
MYTPAYQCHTCGLPMRYDGQCLKCKEPSRHCCYCGIGLCEPDKTLCDKCSLPDCGEITIRCKPISMSYNGDEMFGKQQLVMSGGVGRIVTLDCTGMDRLRQFARKSAEFDVTITPVGQGKPKPEKTIEWAIDILNKRCHLGVEWFKKPWNAHCDIADSQRGYRTFQEAIMAAEWYERNPESK